MKLLKNIFLSSKVLSDAQRSYIQNEMANVVSSQRWGISKFSPQIKSFALKNGWGIQDDNGGIVVNTIGSVTLDDGHQYLIASLADGFPDVDTGIANQEQMISAAGNLLTT